MTDLVAAAAARWPGVPVVQRGRVLRIGEGAARGGGSIVVELDGPKRGAWYDHSTQEGGWLLGERSSSAAALPRDSAPKIQKAGLDVDDDATFFRRVMAEMGPVRGTPGEAYLRRRGIDLDGCVAALRARSEEAAARAWDRLPIGWLARPAAVVFVARGANGDPTAVQLVAVTADGRKDVSRAVVKRTLKAGAGWHRTGAVRLPGWAPFRPLLVAEGPETGLSLWQATGRSVWVALGPHLGQLPFGRRSEVVLCRDADAPLSDADAAAWRQCRLVLERGYRCRVADVRLVGFGPDVEGGGKDFNDLLQAQGEDVVEIAVKAAVEVRADQVEARLARCAQSRAERERARAQVGPAVSGAVGPADIPQVGPAMSGPIGPAE